MTSLSSSSSSQQSQPPMASSPPTAVPLLLQPPSLSGKSEASIQSIHGSGSGSKPPSPVKKSPPLPWSHHETLALIQAYQDKWYSLKKGQLKAFQWEEVAAAVAARCGFNGPTKTSTQCRHKMEKLRKRYRSELQKPYPVTWQYFQLMDQMERGPMPLNVRPITSVKSSPGNADSSNNVIRYPNNGFSHHYASLYMLNADYRGDNISRGDGDESDESDEEWNGNGYGGNAGKRNKSKSINNILRGDVKSGIRSAKRVAMERGFSEDDRFARVMGNEMNGKRKQYYDGDDSDDDNNAEDDLNVEEETQVEEGDDGSGGRELASEIRGFAERFMRIEDKKIEMMREMERYRMEMEKKRMEMIYEAQRKITDTISRAFRPKKKQRMAQET